MFELKCQFLKELQTNTFCGSDHKDANEHIEKVLEIVDLFHIPNISIDQVMLRAFPMSLTGAASRWLRNKPSGSITTWEDLKTKFLSKYYPPARTARKGQILDSRGAIPSKTAADTKVAIQEMAEYSQKWYNGTSRTIKIRASTDAAIRNQGASIKTLEDQIGAGCVKDSTGRGFAKVYQDSTENLTQETIIKSILLLSMLRHLPDTPYGDPPNTRLNGYYCIEKKESCGPQFSEAYSEASHINNSIPKKEKDPGSFTLPCFINNVCFDNAFADLGASVSVMPLSAYLNLGLGELAHTKLTVELVDRTVKYPKGITEKVLVGIGKFIFPIDFIILDMPEDMKVPLILGILRRDQVDDLMPSIEEGEVIEEFRARNDARKGLAAKKSTKLVKYQSSGIL
ncbi:putative ribonuclease H-like domain-containing protein, partial [Tanacetum coccineum]